MTSQSNGADSVSRRSTSSEVKAINSKRLFKHVRDCMVKVDQQSQHRRNLLSLFQPEQTRSRNKLRDACEKLLLLHPTEQSFTAEEVLWKKVFYEVINAVKNGRRFISSAPVALQQPTLVPRFKQFLDSAVGFYQHILLKLQEISPAGLTPLDYPLVARPFSTPSSVTSSPSHNGSSSSSSSARDDCEEERAETEEWARSMTYRVLVCLGNLNRYQMDFFNGSCEEAARRYYQMALLAQPRAGTPYSQMATLTGYKKWWGLTACYYYCCALQSERKYEPAENNLQLFMNFNKNVYYGLPNEALESVAQTEHHTCSQTRNFVVSFLYLCDLLKPNTYSADKEITILCKRLMDAFPVCLANTRRRNDGKEECEQSAAEDRSIGSQQSPAAKKQVDENKENGRHDSDDETRNRKGWLEPHHNRVKHQREPDRLNDEAIFHITVLCLVAVHDLQLSRSCKSSAAIVFTLALFSSLLDHVTAISRAEDDSEASDGDDDDDDDDDDDLGGGRQKQQQLNLADGDCGGEENNAVHRSSNSSEVARKKSSSSTRRNRSQRCRRRRRHTIVAASSAAASRHHDDDENQLSESSERSFGSGSESDDSMGGGDGGGDDSSEEELSESSSRRSSLAYESSGDDSSCSSAEEDGGSADDGKSCKKNCDKKVEEVNSSASSQQQQRRQIVLAPSFLKPLSRAAQPPQQQNQQPRETNAPTTNTKNKKQPSNTAAANEGKASPASNKQKKSKLTENARGGGGGTKATRRRARFERLLGRNHLTSSLKLLADWTSANQSVARSGGGCGALWHRLAALVNMLPDELHFMQESECDERLRNQVKELLEGEKEDEGWKQLSHLPEDIVLLHMRMMQDTFDRLQLSKLKKVDRRAQSHRHQLSMRICRLRQLCREYASLDDVTDMKVSRARGGEKFESTVNLTNEPIDLEKEFNTMESARKRRMMKNMAELRLRTQVAALESSIMVERQRMGGGCGVAFVLPDVSVLCYQLASIRKIAASARFFVVIARTVIDGLDDSKKELPGARDAIRYLEAELRKPPSKSHLRAQKSGEAIGGGGGSGENDGFRQADDVEAWRLYRIIACGRYLIKREADKQGLDARDQQGLVTVLTAHPKPVSAESDKYFVNAVQYAKSLGMQVTSAVSFEKTLSS